MKLGNINYEYSTNRWTAIDTHQVVVLVMLGRTILYKQLCIVTFQHLRIQKRGTRAQTKEEVVTLYT
jgi:hypothetical protein